MGYIGFTMNKPVVFIFISLLCLQSLYAADTQITGKELAADFRAEYNRALNFCGDVSASGSIELNGHYGFKSGLALGWVGDDFEIRIFSSAKVTSLPLIPLDLHLLYNYYGLPDPEYNAHTHSILPYISFNGKWAGIAVGANLRFTRFFHEQSEFESILSFSGYVNFINNKTFRLGMRIANFDDFYVRNLGSYFLNINSIICVTERWSVVNELELYQTGSVGLSSVFYGIAYRGGVRFTW